MNNLEQKAYIFLWFFMCIFAIFAMLYGIFKPMPERTVESKFEVVDQYQNCNVIRWTDPSNRWQYFLKCN